MEINMIKQISFIKKTKFHVPKNPVGTKQLFIYAAFKSLFIFLTLDSMQSYINELIVGNHRPKEDLHGQSHRDLS